MDVSTFILSFTNEPFLGWGCRSVVEWLSGVPGPGFHSQHCRKEKKKKSKRKWMEGRKGKRERGETKEKQAI
jgi:hypothetical protein